MQNSDRSALTQLVETKRRTIADNVQVSFDPYQKAFNLMEYRLVDTVGHTVTFVFNDGSELVFDVTYTARRVAQESK